VLSSPWSDLAAGESPIEGANNQHEGELQVRITHLLWSAVDPTLPSLLPCYDLLTGLMRELQGVSYEPSFAATPQPQAKPQRQEQRRRLRTDTIDLDTDLAMAEDGFSPASGALLLPCLLCSAGALLLPCRAAVPP